MRILFTLVLLLFFSIGFSQTKEIDQFTLQITFPTKDSLKRFKSEYNNTKSKKHNTITTSSAPIYFSHIEQDSNNNKLIIYSLIAAVFIIMGGIVIIHFKKSNVLKYVKKLENENCLEQINHLEEANMMKDKLFSIVSHDLKDSLSSINGFIDLLKDGSLSKEEFDKHIPELSENANNASLLLFNLLNWSKSQMKSLESNPSLFDVQKVFDSKVKLIEYRLQDKGITLINHSSKDIAYADKSMFEIVVQNLLANALKFSKKGDTITIENHSENERCIVSVADSGVGITTKNLENLFKNNSFTTLGTDNEKGTGLGLSICKELIELNQGEIRVESTPNVGSTFYIELPKSMLV